MQQLLYMKKVDYLILGQGFAGTAMAFTLEEHNLSYHIIADSSEAGASKRAVGLVNPITGRRMAKTWLYEELFPLANSFYASVYKLVMGKVGSFLQPLQILKALHSVEEMNYLSGKSGWEGYSDLFSILPKEQTAHIPEIFDRVTGWASINSGGRLNPDLYLSSTLNWLTEREKITNERFNPTLLNQKNGYWTYGNIQSKFVVSCLGFGCHWAKAHLLPLKGQAIMISGLSIPEEFVLKTEKFFIPLPNGQVLAGSTYEKVFDHSEPDQQGINEILADVQQSQKEGIKVVSSWAGIRPTTHNRRPLIFEDGSGVWICNGLGSKGVTLAPWAARAVLQNTIDS